MKCSHLWGEIQNQLNTEGALAEVSNQKHCKQLEMEEGRETEEGSYDEILATVAVELTYLATGLEMLRVTGYMHAGVFGVSQPN